MDGVSIAERDAGDLPFTAAARRLLADARQESGRLRHEYIGTEHLVLALAGQSEDLAVLSRLGVDWARVRALIDETVQPGRVARPPAEVLPYTSRTKRVFALAGEGARALRHAGVGVEHLVLGLVREQKGIGGQSLAVNGLTEQLALAQAQRPDADASTR